MIDVVTGIFITVAANTMLPQATVILRLVESSSVQNPYQRWHFEDSYNCKCSWFQCRDIGDVHVSKYVEDS